MVKCFTMGDKPCCIFSCFVDIMGDFAWKPLVKPIGPIGGDMSSFAAKNRVNLLLRLTLMMMKF